MWGLFTAASARCCAMHVLTEFLWNIVLNDRTNNNEYNLLPKKPNTNTHTPHTQDNDTRNVSHSEKRKTTGKNRTKQQSETARQSKTEKKNSNNFSRRITLCWWMNEENECMHELNDLTPSCWRAAIGRAQIVVFHLFSSCRDCVQSREK